MIHPGARVSWILENALASLQSPYAIWWKEFYSLQKPLLLIFFRYYSFNIFLQSISGLNRCFICLLKKKLPFSRSFNYRSLLQHMPLTFAALSDGGLPDSVRHIVKCSVLFDKFFIVIWSLQLFKPLTLSGAFFYTTCLQNVSRLQCFGPLASAAGFTNSYMALQGQALALHRMLNVEKEAFKSKVIHVK